ncbi:MAG: hypothetical protein SF051_05450 [Elusimicrobiota bacterium]|nr:hypothetical protein [Elusimicrobiota bacterium]
MKHALISRERATSGLLITDDGVKIISEGGIAAISGLPQGYDNRSVYAAPQGTVIGLYYEKDYRPEAESYTSAEYVVLDGAGRKTLVIKKLDGGRVIYPAPSGQWAIAWPGQSAPTTPPVFLHAQKKFEASKWPREFHATSAVFSKSGTTVAITATDGRPRATLIYSSRGSQLSSINQAGKTRFLDGSRRIAIASSGKLILFTDTGSELGRVDVPGADLYSKIAWAPEATSVFVLTGANTLVRADARAVATLWNKNLLDILGDSVDPGDSILPLGIDCSNDAKVLSLALATWHWESLASGGRKAKQTADLLVTLDLTGAMVDVIRFPSDTFLRQQHNDVATVLAADGRRVTVPTKSGLSTYEISR